MSVARDGLLSADEIARAIALGYKVIRHPGSTVEIEANGKAEYGFAMIAVDRIGTLAKEPYYQEFLQFSQPASPPGPASKISVIAIGKLEKGRFGFHSFRKSFIQGLQSLGVPAEIRAAYVGHELDDEHHAAYSRAPTMKELLDAVKRLD